MDNALSALLLLARYHGVAVNTDDITHQFDPEKKGLDIVRWQLAARSLGLHAKALKKAANRLPMMHLPILVWDEKEQKHFILAKIDVQQRKYLIHDLMKGEPSVLSEEEFITRYTGQIIAVTSRASVLGALAKFDFTWFIPAIIKYRKILSEVIVVSLVLQVIALITPLFFQVVMDKVLVHQGFSTLNVISIALLIVVLFEVVLGGIRTYVFAHTTSRIDVELGAKLFRHLLSLPLSYFEARRVGDTVARVRELEQIRQFLTGSALTSVLDL